jgi:hypothetical protein
MPTPVPERHLRPIVSSLGVRGGHLLKLGGLLLVALAALTCTNTVAETTVASAPLVANELSAGTVLEIEAQGIATATNGTDTLTVKLKIGATIIATIAATDVANNDIYHLRIRLVIRTDGAGGTFVACGSISNLAALGTATNKPTFLASTAIDTTAALTIAVTHTWSVANAGNTARNDVFVVTRFGNDGAVGLAA